MRFSVLALIISLGVQLAEATPPVPRKPLPKQSRITAPAGPYRSVPYSSSALAGVRKKFGEKGLLLVRKLNRADSKYLRRQARIIIPNASSEELDYSPLPLHIAEAASYPRLILVSLRVQAFGAYENGQLVRWGPVSTGIRDQPTPATLYFTSWKAARRASSLNRSWIMRWYVNLHTSMGVAFHQYAMPGKPYSHGCIRLLKEDAVWLYGWTDNVVASKRGVSEAFGNPVIVFGEYDFTKPSPWKSLAEDPNASTVNDAEVRELLARYGPAIEMRAQRREARAEAN